MLATNLNVPDMQRKKGWYPTKQLKGKWKKSAEFLWGKEKVKREI